MKLKSKSSQIKGNKRVKLWLSNKAETTKQNYLSALSDFCIVNEIEPEEMIRTIIKEHENRKPGRERSTVKWFNNYIEKSKKADKNPSSVESRIYSVIGFINSNKIEGYTFDSHFIDDNFIKNSKNEEKELLSQKDLKKLIDASKSLKMKAIILSQASAGLSNSDLIKIKVKDFEKGIIELKDKYKNLRKICKLSLNKRNQDYITFLSEEAVQVVENYLKLERKSYKPYEPLFSSSKNIKNPMTSQGVQEAYRKLNTRLGWDNKKGESRKATSRSIQKFFDTQMINSGLNDPMRRYMMGYKVDYPIDDEQLIKNYLEHIDSVTIGPKKSPVSLSQYEHVIQINDELNSNVNVLLDEQEEKEPDTELLKEYNQMREAYESMDALNRVIEIRMNAMEQRYKKLEEELEKLKQK